jgi:putative nucleotidyltransferase with HDIG domain
MRASPKSRFQLLLNRGIFGTLLLLVMAAGAALILIAPLSSPSTAIPLGLGDVASQDILAPRALSYQSEVLTQLKRQEAAANVQAQYAPPSSSIARAQVNILRDVLEYIAIVRADSFSSQEQKIADLAAIQSINLAPESAQALVSLNDTSWQSVQQESISVLEQVMRSTVREDRLEEARRTIPALVSLSLPEEQASLVSELASAFVAPNSLYSEELTEEKRALAMAEAQPVVQSYVAGETVVPRGHVITESDLEALDQFGLLQPEISWEDRASIVALVAINFTFIALYFAQRPDLRSNPTGLVLMSVLFLIFLLGARLIIPNRTIVPYMFPVAGFGMLVAALVSSRAALILALPLAILTGYGFSYSYELTLFYLFSSSIGILLLRNIHRLLSFFWAGFGAAISGAIVIIAFRLTDPLLDAVGLLQLGAASLFHGLAAATLTILLQFLLAQILGLTTTLQLIEISRPDHPLLQTILRNAPGTYQHSLQIANLAEQAAERIGADTLLTRVGALYHDAGKVRYPLYFIENQVAGAPNPHDSLPPEESAAIIIQHVTDGVDLAAQHRLPKRIVDFILEHHGTMKTNYQYHNAVKAAGGDPEKVDESLFTYPGPRPQSRETALVMLADGVEARSRAERPESEDSIYALVKDTVEQRLARDQLADTDLTIQNIQEIIDSFTTTLRGVFHPRIEYPASQAITLRSKDKASLPEETP